MNGGSIYGGFELGVVPTTWSVAGTGDFNSDGKGDIFWRDQSGSNAIWLMNSNGTIQTNAALGTVPTNWAVRQTGDYNGDGKSDIVWQDTTGNVVVWLMNGTSIATSANIGSAPVGWIVQGQGAD